MGWQRAIDVPIERLPAIDEHAVSVAAPPAVAWTALLDVVEGSLTGRIPPAVASLLGCAETEAHGSLDHPGGTLPGFVVSRVIPPAMLALLGVHRFSRYALVFHVDALPGGGSAIRAETRADFPGPAGSVYRALVIGLRIHVLVVRRLLRSMRRRAERG